MHVIVITGAPGIGKSAVLPHVVALLPEKSAFVDGDCVGRTRPTTRTRERLDLIQDNIRVCADNFARWGARHLVTAFVFPSGERVRRIVGITDDNDLLATTYSAKDHLDDPAATRPADGTEVQVQSRCRIGRTLTNQDAPAIQ